MATYSLEHDYQELRVLRMKMVDVATALGTAWTFEPSMYESTWHAGTLRHMHGGMQLSVGRITYGHAKGRLTIRGEYLAQSGIDAYDAYGERLDYHSITVSPDRSAAAIARDITKRLLPAYIETLAKVTHQIQQIMDYRALGETTVRHLAAVADNAPYSNDGKGTYTIRLYQGPLVWGDVTVYGDRISMQVHNMAPDMAAVVLEAIMHQDYSVDGAE